MEYLKQQYSLGHFLASGRKVPRTGRGGVILSNVSDRNALNKILSKDPSHQNNLANYEIIEFIPNMAVDQLQFLIDKK